MAKIVRYNGNLVPFASSSLGTERTIFGEITQADDITSQFTPDFLRGWGIVGPSDQPTLQDFNAVSYTHGQILAYLHQIGIAEYNSAQEYHIGSFASLNGAVFSSKTNSNTGNNPGSSPSNWALVSQPTGITHIITGSGNFTVPAGVYKIFAEVWGGGGAGGGTGTAGQTAGGGGGGGYSQKTIDVIPGQLIAYSVGAAGVPASGAAGGNGGSTIFATISAAGGIGGSPNPVGNGGAGGAGSGGDVNYTGGGGTTGAGGSGSIGAIRIKY